jgi:hypothetical protein
MGKFEIIGLLVRAYIKGPDDNLPVPHFFRDFFIGGVLLFFRGVVLASHVEKLAPEQANPFGVIRKYAANIRRIADIGKELYFPVVKRSVGQPD